VGKRDLNIIAEVCYQISDDVEDVDKLPNKSKRIMLYCWYATNIYSLNGKGNRGKPPDRLEYAIKAKYPMSMLELPEVSVCTFAHTWYVVL